MLRRLIPVLCATLLTGCATSEPQTTSYTGSPVAAPSVQPAPAMTAPTTVPPGLPTTQATAAFPAAPDALPAAPGTASAYGQPVTPNEIELESGASRCRTVGDATMCDAPADPYADTTHNTN